jgi:outer membrane protein assembly factor BamA
MRFSGIILILFCVTWGQAQKSDSTGLPFAIAREKKMPEEELEHKREGIYVTGVPDISSDPINGFGIGGEGSIFFDGKRSDPFFAYTPYRFKADVALFATTRNQRELMVRLDAPYFLNSKWRLRMEAAYEVNPNLLYFGIDRESLKGLKYYPGHDSTAVPVDNADYPEYEKQMSDVPYGNYNTYNKEEYILNVSAERSYVEGKFRVLGGYELAQVNMSTFNGYSLLKNDFLKAKAPGVGNSLVSIVQAGLIYDDRDLETDPARGIFCELTNELSLSSLGSAFDFNKVFFHFNLYRNLLPKAKFRTVLAFRTSYGITTGDAPFFEYQDQWSSEGSIEGLGGPNTLRGFKQSRFLGRIMTFHNIEIRQRFAQATLLKQHLTFAAVPFFDIGSVYDSASELGDLKRFRYCGGLGFRIAWNVNTILRLDFAVSKEDQQFFLNLAHAF